MSDFLSVLNEPQKEAVLDFKSPLLVLAGAGSGKTRVITTKIAYAIKELGYAPYQILAVTFTNRAAKEMRERVQALLPDMDLAGLELRTFHSYGAYILRRYGTLIGLNDNFNIYDDEDSLSLLSSCFPNEEKKELKQVQKEIAKFKDLGSFREEDLKRVEYHVPSFSEYFRRYQEALKDTGCVDFADLICRTTELLDENPQVKEKLRHRYRLILVDEYQDSNSAQFKLLYDLIGEHTQICVVGDDDQSIYRFRGAEIKNILSFPEKFKGTHVVKLEQNYRSTASILKIATTVIQNNVGRHEKTLWTENAEGKKPIVINAVDVLDEARRIAAIIKTDGNYNNTAVLYRMNMLSQSIERAFLETHIPYKVIGGLRFYDREEIKDMLSWFSLILNSSNQVAFMRLINKPARGLGKKTLEKIVAHNIDFVSATRHCVETKGCSGKALHGLQEFLICYDTCYQKIEDKEPFPDILKYLLNASGLQGYYESEKDERILKTRLENLSELANVLKEVKPGFEGLASFLETLMLDNTTIGSKDPGEQDGVTLMTMHTTKGLEYDRVFVIGLEEGIIPGDKSSKEADIEEERRLFYVAVTRARKELYLSWAQSRSKWGGFAERTIPSRFLEEIPNELLNNPVMRSSAFGTTAFSYQPREKSYSSNNNNAFFSSIPQKRTIPNYKIGDSVRSSEYGVGKIVDKSMKNGRTHIKVQFEFQSKILDAQFARLEIVSSESSSSSPTFAVGDRVRSVDYGIGVVIKRELIRNKEIIEVEFEGTTARFNVAFARLEKV